jgi:hypothetical protein
MTHNEHKGLGRKWYNYSTVIIHMTKTDIEKEGTTMSDTTRRAHTLRRMNFILFIKSQHVRARGKNFTGPKMSSIFRRVRRISKSNY